MKCLIDNKLIPENELTAISQTNISKTYRVLEHDGKIIGLGTYEVVEKEKESSFKKYEYLNERIRDYILIRENSYDIWTHFPYAKRYLSVGKLTVDEAYTGLGLSTFLLKKAA